MNALNLTEKDWLKLRDFNKAIAKRIQMRLPADWCLTIEDIEGAVYDSFIKLLEGYKPGAMSPTSYCYQFGEEYTFRDLIRQYKKLKQFDSIDELYGEDKDDDEPCRHKYGIGEVQALSVDERNSVVEKIDVNSIIEKMPKLDKMIAQMIMEGHTYDEIADNLGIDRKTAMRRMKKYMKNQL